MIDALIKILKQDMEIRKFKKKFKKQNLKKKKKLKIYPTKIMGSKNSPQPFPNSQSMIKNKKNSLKIFQ